MTTTKTNELNNHTCKTCGLYIPDNSVRCNTCIETDREALWSNLIGGLCFALCGVISVYILVWLFYRAGVGQ